ncbi:hypothetical protein Dsin_013911 [Dipteronia sinensis]|uniref:Uncharacterized protein n=1 Tax=Dipteronia sinensis TaxID=43782 RepID=A0AAE0AKS4_9ROSI|nr:hypothetical protein Dsin_013911 [Dipteronia sinensis]
MESSNPADTALINSTYYSCITVPPKINSNGLFSQLYAEHHKQVVSQYTWLDYSAPRLQLLIFLMFTVTQATHFVLKRIGLPSFRLPSCCWRSTISSDFNTTRSNWRISLPRKKYSIAGDIWDIWFRVLHLPEWR